MTDIIELAKRHGIQYRLAPENTTEMWCYDRNVQSFGKALRAESEAEITRLRAEVESLRADAAFGACVRRLLDVGRLDLTDSPRPFVENVVNLAAITKEQSC